MGFSISEFGSQLILGRWFIIFGSVMIMAVSGSGYIFGLYSNRLKSSLGYDQATLNLVSFFKDLGGSVGVLSGLINEVAPPWVVISIGAAMNFFGYFMMWLGITNHLNKLPVWQMCVYIFIAANSQTFANTGSMVTCVNNFPESRGIVIGLLKGYVGLSGAILTQIYHALYGRSNSKALLLLLAWLPATVFAVFLPTIRVVKVDYYPNRRQNEVKFFYHFLYISLSLAGFLMVLIIVQNSLAFTKAGYYGTVVVVVFLLLLPLAIVAKEEYYNILATRKMRNNSLDIVANKKREENLQIDEVSNIDGPKNQMSCLTTIFKPPSRGEDYSILQALLSIDMLVLFVATTCGLGGTLTAVDNLGQIGSSQGYPHHSIATFVSLISIWNFLGRVASGFASEFFLAKYKFPRPLVMTLVLLLSCFGHLLIALAIPNSLYVASMIIGFCLGAQWPLVYAIISDIFGLKYFSTLFNFGAVASPVGSYMLNVMVAGKLYDREALKQLHGKGLKREVGQELNCIGVACYKVSFLIICGVTLFGSLVSLILVFRTWKFYKGDIYKKFREEDRIILENDKSTIVEIK